MYNWTGIGGKRVDGHTPSRLKATSLGIKTLSTFENTWKTHISLRKMRDAMTKLDRFLFPAKYSTVIVTLTLYFIIAPPV